MYLPFSPSMSTALYLESTSHPSGILTANLVILQHFSTAVHTSYHLPVVGVGSNLSRGFFGLSKENRRFSMAAMPLCLLASAGFFTASLPASCFGAAAAATLLSSGLALFCLETSTSIFSVSFSLFSSEIFVFSVVLLASSFGSFSFFDFQLKTTYQLVKTYL